MTEVIHDDDGTEIVRVPFAEALGSLHTVPAHRYEEAAALFG